MAADPAPKRAARLRRATVVASVALALPLSAAATADAHATRDGVSHSAAAAPAAEAPSWSARHRRRDRWHRRHRHHRVLAEDATTTLSPVTTSTDDATPTPVATVEDNPSAGADDTATPVATVEDNPSAGADDTATPVATVEDNPSAGADDTATPVATVEDNPSAGADDGATDGAWWKPGLGLTWQWQLTGDVDTSVEADVYDLDLFDTEPETVAALHAAGRKVVCYFSAGSSEDWRPDFAAFPASVQGAGLDGWPGEKWLDVRALDELMPIMQARLDQCKSKGFDGVEADNVDGYANDSGFPLTGDDQLAYIRALAAAAHERGLAYGLKNDLEQVADLVGDTDFAVNEQCHEYGECELLAPFTEAGKPVFNAEYGERATTTCADSDALGLSTIFKSLDLDAARETCS